MPAAVMTAIKKRRGLCAEIARQTKLSVQAVAQWPKVPKRYMKLVADLTGLPVSLMEEEHIRAWTIPVEEVTAPCGTGLTNASKPLKRFGTPAIRRPRSRKS